MIKGFILKTNRNGIDEELRLNAYTTRKLYSVEGVLSASQKVYEDAQYTIKLDADEEYRSATVRVNGEELESVIISNEISFNVEHKNSRIFAYMLGVAQISVKVKESDDIWRTYYSDYASVMISSTYKHQAVARMVEFVYRNQSELLTKRSRQPGGSIESNETGISMASQISMLESIVDIYESQYGYFKINARSKLKPEEVVDGVEKLQNVGLRTIQYMIQHPEHLKRSLRGIRCGRQEYLPDKTLVVKNMKSRDIYENRVLMAFIRKLMTDVNDIKKHLEDYLVRTDLARYQEPGYMVSLEIIYLSAERAMKEYMSKINELDSRLKKVYAAYLEIFDVKTIDCAVSPKATAIFTTVPQYKKVFEGIVRWYRRSDCDFVSEQNMLHFTNVSEIYEIYVLAKMVSAIKAQGYVMTESGSYQYRIGENTYQKSKIYNNTFGFVKDKNQLVLYYEPVIRVYNAYFQNSINLFRNNTISLQKDPDRDDESRGEYYVPDFVIKGVCGKEEHYAVCDAKYANIEKVRGTFVPSLAYKYLISLSPKDRSKGVKSLNLMYGLHDSRNSAYDFYDRQGSYAIRPSIRLVPFTESVDEERIKASMTDIIMLASGKFSN